MRPPSADSGRVRGVSLIEALVALAVMSFGMLAVVGVQGTLRLNSDIAKQRSEAVRIAEEAIESWRSFAQLASDPAGLRRAYADVATTGVQSVPGYTTNTAYLIERTVMDVAGQNHKSLRVVVRWTDRSGNAQSVTLDSLLAGIDPALSASVVNVAAPGLPPSRPLGRHGGVPREAKDIGGLSSVFKPPVSDGGADGAGGTVAWVFDNLSGMITGVCSVAAGTTTSSLSAADVAACRDNTVAHLLSGYVRFATTSEQPTAAVAESPGSPARNLDIELRITDGRVPTCFDDAPATSVRAATQTVVTYYCSIPANADRTWEGHSTIVPRPFTDVVNSAWAIPARALPDGVAPDHQLCRYTPAANDSQVIPNWQHPYLYHTEYADPLRRRQPLPMPPLVDQNFLVILIHNNCPTDVPADPARGDFVNSNTLVHRPRP